MLYSRGLEVESYPEVESYHIPAYIHAKIIYDTSISMYFDLRNPTMVLF